MIARQIGQAALKMRHIVKSSPALLGFVRAVNACRLRFRDRKSTWQAGLRDESLFWNHLFTTDFKKVEDRLDLSNRLPSPIGKVIDRLGLSHVRLLDVGCGPIIIGGTWKEAKIELVGADPLADQYTEMLIKAKAPSEFRIEKTRVEDLAATFGENSFDIVHASNSIDHCEDPVEGIRQMLRVAKPGGAIMLSHLRNEGHSNAYHGLHQHNFDLVDGAPVVWSPLGRTNLLDEIETPAEFEGHLKDDVVHWVWFKRPDLS